MKKLLLITTLVFAFYQTNAKEIVINKYSKSFEKAYQAHPEIPTGILEAVSFCNTHFYHLQHESVVPESCTGMPNAYGVMGLTLDGQNYFADNLHTVSSLSGFSMDEIINDPEKNILAYADAYFAVKKLLDITGNDIADQLKVLTYLSELPHETTGQNFALNTQLYGYLQFLSTVAYQQLYGFPDYHIDFEKIFGANNYEVLSSTSLTVTDEDVSNNEGKKFQTKSVQSADYAPALWNAAGSCNYSTRGGVAVSAIVIHDIEGTYAGCISWFQNCSAGVSAHYVLRSSDGQITQMVLESNKAWHIGSENPYTIGFEHEGYVAQTGWYTNAMYTTSAALARDICNSGYGISPLRTYFGPGCTGSTPQCGIGACTKIKGHQMFPNQTHNDPGINWNWAKYYLLVNDNPSINTITSATGNFYDSGGASADYSDDERFLTLIQPSGASSVTLNFTSFDTELNWDYLFIYDGATTSAQLIGQYSGTTSPGTVTSTGGSLLLEFRSDCATTATGWAATWTSSGGGTTSAPANNECSAAITLTQSATCNPANGTTVDATQSITGACAGTPDDDVWYQFVATTSNPVIKVVGASPIDVVVDLSSGTCTGTNISCADATGPGGTETMNTTGLTVGTTYLIRIYGYGTGASTQGTFTVCVIDAPLPPSNDDCASAITLTQTTSCNPANGTTIAATQSMIGTCPGTSDDDVWYQFVATTPTPTISISIVGTAPFDPVLDIRSGGCTGTNIYCADSTGPGGSETIYTSGLTIGTNYFTRVYGWSASNQGAFTICVFNGTTTGISTIENSGNLNVYPNPFTNVTTITYMLSENSDAELTLSDVLGKEIILYSNPNQPSGKHELSINSDDLHLSTGMYFVKLKTKKGQTVTKAIVK